MTDDQSLAHEASDEVVPPEAEQVEAAEAPESTEGQEDTPPAEDKAEDAEADEKISKSKIRRERRKARARELEEKAARATREKAEADERLNRISEAAKEQKPPTEAEFQDYNEYLIAVGAWQAAQRIDQRDIQEVQKRAEASDKELEAVRQQQQVEANENWAAQSNDARTRYADFDAVISAPTPDEFTPAIAEIIKASDMGADVAYHLGTHRAELREIAVMSPIEQAMAIGRLEATIQAPKPRTQSSAPDPVSAVRPKGTAASDPAKMTPDEYRQWRANGGTF